MQTGKPPGRRPPDRDRVAQIVAEAVTQPRELTPQVLTHLLAHHDVPEDGAAAWLQRELAELEAYELELLLSPLFTPSDETRLALEESLGTSFLTADDVAYVLEELADRDLELVVDVEGEFVTVEYPHVVVERFVRLLHADTPLPAAADEGLLDDLDPEARRHLRDPTWLRPSHRELFPVLFDAARRAGDDLAASIRFLTEFVRSHRPSSRADCVRLLADVAAAYEEDLRKYKAGDRSFFDAELKATHAGKWGVRDGVITSHERAIALSRSLHHALES